MVDDLYENIGGSKTISKLVSVFYDKVTTAPRLSRFFGHADMETLRSRQVMFLTMLFGGSRTFSGRDLATAHASSRQQGLDDADFDELLSMFRASLLELGVAPGYAEEAMKRLEATRDAVLGRQ